MELFSPAKINLGLRVYHRRPEDGCHYIHSLFVPISFGDQLSLSRANEDCLSSDNHLDINQGWDAFEKVSERGDLSKNLVWQALELTRPLRSEAIHVHLTKCIPPGSGLGGGSSNAGVLLRYIANCLVPTNSHSHLMEQCYGIARQLGADVPFFLQEKTQLVGGIGDWNETVSIGPGIGILALSGIMVATQKAYSLLKRPLQATLPPKTLEVFSSFTSTAIANSNWQSLGDWQNDFESVVFPLYEPLKEMKTQFLESGASYASMSGSGSSIYALVDSTQKQALLQERMFSRFPEYSFIPFHFLGAFH